MTRTYQAVLDRIEHDLHAGRLAVGGRLPGERVLADRYGVARSSVREAVRVLEAMGLIRTATGSGPEAGATLISEPATPIGSALRWHLASRHLPVADLVQARVLIETWAVAEAAQRSATAEAGHAARSAVARTGLVSLLDAMDAPDLPAGEFLALDTRFHVGLAELAGNAVIAAVMAAMREAIQGYVTAAVDLLADWESMAVRLRAEHRGILDAVATGDREQASARVAAHIQGFYATTGVGR